MTVITKTFSFRRGVSIAVSTFLVVLTFTLARPESIFRELAKFPTWAVAIMLVLLAANLLIVSFRFWRLLAHFGVVLPWSIALRANIAGNVAGLIVIPLLGQIVGRQSVLHSFGVQPVVSASLAAYERTLMALLSGVAGTMGGIYLLGLSAMAGFVERIAFVEIAFAGCGGWALSIWLGGSRFEKNLLGRVFSRESLSSVMQVAGLTLTGQLLMLGCFVVGIQVVGPDLSFVSMFAAASVISLAATVPITVGGWGVREIAAMYVLGILNVPASQALAMSVMVGVCSTLVILVSTPFYFWKPFHAHV